MARKVAVSAEGDPKNMHGKNEHERTEHVLLIIMKLHFVNFRRILTIGAKGTVGARISILS